MGQYNVKPTGSKSTGFSADWTDAECYPTLQAAINRGITSADVITLDDTTHDIGSTNWVTSNAASGVHFVINSRSGDRDTCICNVTSTTQVGMRLGRSGRVYTYAFSNIGFKKSVSHTIINAVFVFCEFTDSLDTEFINCKFFDASVTYAGTGINGYFRIPTGATRTMKFTDCLFDNLVSSNLGGRFFAYHSSGATLWFDGCTFSNIAHTCTDPAQALSGGINGDGITKITNCIFDTITQTHDAASTLPHQSFVSAEGHLIVEDSHASNIVTLNGTAGATWLRAENTYAVENIIAEDCSSTPTTGTNSVGGVFLAMGDAAQGTIAGLTARRCTSDHGVALYCSQGGGGVFTNIVSENCTSRVLGIFYFGGWGDCYVDGFSILGATTGVIELFATKAGAIYAHVHGSAPRAKISSYKNGYIRGAVQLDGVEPAISMYNENSSKKHTVILENIVIDNPGSVKQIKLSTTVGATLNISGGPIYVDGGESTLDTDNNLGPGTTALVFVNARQTVRIGVARNNSVTRRAV